MEVRKVHPDRTLIELMPEEEEQLRQAMERLQETFLAVSPVVMDLNNALAGAANAAQRFSAVQEACQRLDPAFSGPNRSETEEWIDNG